MIEEKKILALLEALNDNGLKFEFKGTDTLYIKFPEMIEGPILHDVLIAILDSQPDEWGLGEKGFRLWWD